MFIYHALRCAVEVLPAKEKYYMLINFMCLKLLTPYLTFDISVAVCIHMVVFWIMTLCCSVVGGYQYLQYNILP